MYNQGHGDMAKLVDALISGVSKETCAGSNPVILIFDSVLWVFF